MAALARVMRSARTALLLLTLAAMPLALTGCEEELDAGVTRVKIGNQKFILEVVSEPAKVARGLMERDHIEDDGGMLFVFSDSQVRLFWMKNCIVDMDILFLDGNGRVLTIDTMKAQKLRGELEDNRDETMDEYEARIRATAQHSSRYPAQFVIEIQAGRAEMTGVKEGDLVRFDTEGLKALVK